VGHTVLSAGLEGASIFGKSYRRKQPRCAQVLGPH